MMNYFEDSDFDYISSNISESLCFFHENEINNSFLLNLNKSCSDLNSFNLANQEKEYDNDKSKAQINIKNKNTQPPSFNQIVSNESIIDNPDLNINENENENKSCYLFDDQFVRFPEYKIIEDIPEDKTEKNKQGRKRKNSKRVGIYNKFSQDNIITKIKTTLLNFLRIYINSFINKKFNGNIGEGIFKKEILKMNPKQIINNKLNKNLLNKTLKDIFSHEISRKYSNFESDHNKKLIEFLLNEVDEEKRIEFENLFNLTFMDGLNHFSGIKPIPILKGMKLLKDLCEKFKDDQMYVKLLKYNTLNFKKIIMDKKSRDRTIKNIL